MRVANHLAAVLLVLTAAAPVVALPSRPDRGWVTDGPVTALGANGGVVYAGGTFGAVAPRTGALAVAPRGGAIAGTADEFVGTVRTVRPDGGGGWYVGGDFSVVDRPSVRNVAHIDASGVIDPSWAPVVDGPVTSLAITPTQVILAGTFTRLGGAARAGLGAVARSGGATLAWAPEPNGPVDATLLDAAATTVFVGGQFTRVGGLARNRVAALSSVTGAATAWDPNADGPVTALAFADASTLLIGGTFGQVGGQGRNRLASIGVASGSVGSWDPNADAPVTAIAVGGGVAYVAGAFANVGGAPRAALAAVSLAGTGTATPWDPAPGAQTVLTIPAIAVANGAVIVGGTFTSVRDGVGRTPAFRVASLDPVTGSALPGFGAATGPVSAIGVAAGGATAIGGSFSGIGGVARGNLAAFDGATGAPTAWAPTADGAVNAITASRGAIAIGGAFANVSGAPRARLALLDAASGGLAAWNPGADDDVLALADAGGTILAGGRFTIAGGLARPKLAAIDAAGRATTWNPRPNADVYSLGVTPSAVGVVVGGQFGAIGTQAPQPVRNGLAILDVLTGAAAPWNPTVVGSVSTVAAIGSGIIAAGPFTAIGGQAPTPARAGLATVANPTALTADWNPAPDGETRSIAAIDGRIAVGGAFGAIGPAGARAVRRGVAELDAVSGAPTAFDPGVAAPAAVDRVLSEGRSLWIAGAFTRVGATSQAFIASFTNAPGNDRPPTIAGAATVDGALTCDGGAWTGAQRVAMTWLRAGTAFAIGPTVKLGLEDVALPIVCRATATNRGGDSVADSAPVAIGGPRNTRRPSVSGNARVGFVIACDPGTWSGRPTFTYAWLRGSAVIQGQRTLRYTARWADAGRSIACRVRATDASGATEVTSPGLGRTRGNVRVPDRRGIPSARVHRVGSVIVIVPARLPRRSPMRPRMVPIRVQSPVKATSTIRIAAGVSRLRIRAGSRVSTRVRAGAVFLPGVRAVPVRITIRVGRRVRTVVATIRLT